MHFFSSPTSNILPSTFAPASVAMSRSDSRDSATSTTSYTHHYSWDVRPRSSASATYSSNGSLSSHAHEASHRRTSSSSSSSSCSAAGWTPSPYRSCLTHVEDASSSYLSDDDLLDLPTLEVDLIESPVQKELSTEEQIEMLRAYREREEALYAHHHGPTRGALHQHVQPQKKSRVVRFASDESRRSSTGRTRPSALRRS